MMHHRHSAFVNHNLLGENALKRVIRNVEILPPKVLQVGNMLQVVPSQEPPPPPPPQQSIALTFNTNSAVPPPPVVAPLPKLNAPSQPVSVVSLPFPPPDSPNLFLKLEEIERRKKEKEIKRKQKREQKAARRMLRKAMLKKRLAKANEAGITEANTEDLLEIENDDLEASKTSLTLPSPDKGVLINIKDTSSVASSKRKFVSFADGIRPGEGTSPSGGEEHPLSPPPLIRKPIKKRKKRKVKVRIIRIDSSNPKEESEEDDLTPPPPPPGTPPPEAYLEYTASGRYLYPIPCSQTFSVNQDGGTVFPSVPTVTSNSVSAVQFSAPPPPQQR